MMSQGLVPVRKDVFLVTEDLPRYYPATLVLRRQELQKGDARAVGKLVRHQEKSWRLADESPRNVNSPPKQSVFACWKVPITSFPLALLPCQRLVPLVSAAGSSGSGSPPC